MIIRTQAACKQYTWDEPGGVTESCFWDDEEAAKVGIHNLLERPDYYLRKWKNNSNRKHNRERAQYRYLHDTEFLAMRRMRAKRLNHTLRRYWEWLVDRLDYRCQICGDPFEFFDLEVDHIIPLSRGGQNVWDNIQPLCESCNARKNDKIIPPSTTVLEAQKIAVSLGIIKHEGCNARKSRS